MMWTFTIAGIVFVVVLSVWVLGVILENFRRMRGMANRIFTLAEQEMEQKLREGQSGPAGSPGSSIDPAVCSHCGSRVASDVAQCPNCGASLP